VSQRTKRSRAVKVIGLCTLISLGITRAIVARSATDGAESANSKMGEGLEEIVVTARKVEESLQRVPISVSAITADELQQRSIDTLSEVGQGTPNFTFGQGNGPSGRSAGVIYIRGVGQSDPLPTYDPAVGLYVDGVFLGRMQATDLDMMDIQRVEILRGPQGTLFGKNTSGGAINIITRRPDPSAGISGRLQTTGGNFGRFDVLGDINMPLVADTAALLVSGSHRKQDGYGRRADGGDMGNTNRNAGRVSLLVKPSEYFSALLAFDGTSYDESNAVVKLLQVNTSIATIAALNQFTPAKYDGRWLSPTDFFSYGTGPNSSRGQFGGTSLTLDFDAGWADIKSISAYRLMYLHNDLDPDGSPVTVLSEFETVRQHQYSQEVQATGKSLGDRLSWVGGVYYFSEAGPDNPSYELFTPLLGGSGDFTSGNYINNNSIAGYAQGSYKMTERWRLTAGARLTHDRKEDTRVHAAFPSGVLLQPTLRKSASSNDVSPRVGLDYQWTSDVMMYVSAAKGYKAGGFNGRAGTPADFAHFEPERVWTYEVGLRSDLLDRRVRLNGTAFYSRYSDLQLQVNGSTISGGAPVPFNIVSNIPKARITGGELEIDVMPLPSLTLTSGLGLTDAKYTELPTNPQFVSANLVHLNNQFVNTPKVSVTVGAEYTKPVTSAFNLTTRVDYSYRSAVQYTITNSPLLRQSPYGLLNARLTLEFGQSHMSFSVFGTNLTDRHYFSGGYDDADVPHPGLGFSFADMAPPRQYGASVQWRF
jgi:iron complex outermembrane recepter protein